MGKRKIVHAGPPKKLIRGINLKPCVLLTRLTQEEIDRHTGRVQNENPYGTYIKEEPVDEHEVVTQFTRYEVTYQENHSRIKIEPVDLDLVKTEPLDTYENTISSSTFTNFYGTFNCKVCYKVFNNYEEFVVHKNLAHKDQLKYACQFCNEKFGLNAHLNIHLLVHLDKPRLQHKPFVLPPITPVNVSPNNNLSVRQKRKYERKKEEIKKERSKKVCKVTNVVEQQCTTQSNGFKCLCCNFTTDSMLNLNRHKKNCNKKQESNSNKNNKPFNCTLCSNSYINNTALNGHMRYHSLRGDMISKRSLRKKGVYIKPVKNGAVKPKPKKEKEKIFCTVCDKQFVFAKRLEIHMKLHGSVKTDNSKQRILKNRKYVSKSLKFSVKSSNPNTSNNRKNRQNSLKPFQCPHCRNYYSSKRSLSDHIKLFHAHNTTVTPPLLKRNKTPSTECDYCNILISKGNLSRHISSFHSDD